MSIKKTVRRKTVSKDGFLHKAKKKLRSSTNFVLKQQSELVRAFNYAKTSTKVVLVSLFIGLFLFGIVSITRSLTSISDKRAELDDIERKIATQQKLNKELENELKGDLDALFEEKAREQEMIYPDEQVFINNAG